MRPRVRRLGLVVHIGASVGWLGAVVASLALGVIAVSGAAAAPAAREVLPPLGWSTLVPLSLASLVTGVIQACGTRWGLFRHYWVVAKLVMNVFASGVLLLYLGTLGHRAAGASPVIHAAAAVVLLVIALVLSVCKPRGELR